jgi:hypothetical protein
MKKASVTTAVWLVLLATGAARSVPYTVDSHTRHLYHFNGDGKDSVSTSPIDLVLDSGATAADIKIPALGPALYTYDGKNTANANAPSAMASTATAISSFVGADGAFTFEALVCPALELSATPNNMQIISGEHDSTRGWQFRWRPGATCRSPS